MTDEQLLMLRRKINTLNNYAYSAGMADENEYAYKRQKKYERLAAEAADAIYDFVIECSSTAM
jgi:hypothetical protein